MVIHYQLRTETKHKMDLWNRTVPEKLPSERVPSENSRCREPQQGAHRRSALTLPIVDDGFTLPFDMDITITYGGVPRPSPGARDNETPMVGWPMPPMIQGEPPRDFEDLRGFMEGERYPSCIVNPRKHPQERGTTPVNISTNRPTERPQFVTPVVRDERAAHSGYGHGAAGDSTSHESTVRSGGHPRPEDHFNDERNVRGPGFDYERNLPAGSHPRGRASANRPQGYLYEEHSPRHGIIPEFLFNEPQPRFPTFSGRHDEWEAFWLKFQLMSRRYSWSEEKQREQLLFCLKGDALNFAATLRPVVRDDLMMFSMSLRDTFSHRTPAETVRASLNNIKKSSRESIHEYASRVREMMTKAYPDIGMSETFNQLMIHHLLQGLSDQSIAYEVLIRKPRTLSQAVDMITWHECCKETTSQQSGIQQLRRPDTSGETTIPREDFHTQGVRRVNGKRSVTGEHLLDFGGDLKMPRLLGPFKRH